jgi:hypothetical protein
MTQPAAVGSNSGKFGSEPGDFLDGFKPSNPTVRDLVIVRGDIWRMHATGDKVVVTTNIGWDPRTLANNMGAGVALQAAMRWPELPRWYGAHCKRTAPQTPVVERADLGLIFFPVKPLLEAANPERSWDQQASLGTIEQSLRELSKLEGRIALAFPGCGNGGLDRAMVEPLLRRYLTDDRFTVVDRTA